MAEWRRAPIADAALRSGDALVDGPFGSNLKADEYVEAGVRLVQLQNIGQGHWIDRAANYISEAKAEALRRHQGNPGDVAIAKMADPVARACRLPEHEDKFVVVADCIRLRVDEERYHPGFVTYAINSAETRSEAEAVATGSTRIRINLGQLRRISIPAPPLEEQRRIAEVLDTIDESIQATERVIAKLDLTARGLLRHQLSGLLGGPMAPLSELGAEVTVGIVVRPTQYYVTDGVPVLRSANVREGGLEMTNLVFMSSADHALMAKSAVAPGDLVTVRTGYPGTTAVIPDSVPQANCVDVVITRTGPSIDSEFLSLWVNSDYGKGHVLARQGGLAQQHFNVGDMKALLVPVLDRPEQRRLVAVRNALTDRLRAEESSLSKLRRTRVGLAEDLLSGRVRTVAA